VLQDVGGIRRFPGEQPEVSTTADVFKLFFFVFRCVTGDGSDRAH
jgi:hypothetical protein